MREGDIVIISDPIGRRRYPPSEVRNCAAGFSTSFLESMNSMNIYVTIKVLRYVHRSRFIKVL